MSAPPWADSASAGAVTNSEVATASTATSSRRFMASPRVVARNVNVRSGSPAATHPGKNRRRFGTEANHIVLVRASAGSGQDGQNGHGHNARDANGTPYTRPMSDVLEFFTELAAIPSPPGEERAVADRVSTYLEALALEVDEDDAGLGSAPTPATCSPGCPRPRRTAASRSSSAHISTRFRPPRRSSPSSRTAWCETPAGRSSARTTRPPSPRCSRPARRILAENRPHAGIELLFAEGGRAPGPRHSTRRACRQTRDSSSTREHQSAKSFSALRTRVRSRW